MTYRRTPPRPRRRPGAPARRHQWTPAAVERKRAAERRRRAREYAEVRAWWARQDWHAIAATARARGEEFSRLYARLEATWRDIAARIERDLLAALGVRLEVNTEPVLEPVRGRRPDLVLVDDLPPEILEEPLKLGPGPADE